MSQPTTFEEAVERQRLIHAKIDANEPLDERAWRAHSLREGYVYRPALDYGLGYYAVDVVTGAVCEWNGKWSDDEDVLLCQDCFLDGT